MWPWCQSFLFCSVLLAYLHDISRWFLILRCFTTFKKKKKRFYCCHSIFHVEERWDPEWKRGAEKHMCTSVKNDNTSILTSIKEKRNYILGSFHISFIQSVFNSLLHPAYLRNKDIRETWRGSLPFINIDWYSHCSFSLEKITPKNCKRKN